MTCKLDSIENLRPFEKCPTQTPPQLGFHNSLSPVLKLDIHHPRKQENKTAQKTKKESQLILTRNA